MTERDDEVRFTVLAPRPVRRVLVGVSLEPGEGGVLAAAVAVARATGATLSVVHAAEAPAEDWALPIAPIPVEDLRSRLAVEVETFAGPAKVPYETEVAAGAAHRILDEAARRGSPDLIVVGATARRSSALLGSTAERVVRKATVRAGGPRRARDPPRGGWSLPWICRISPATASTAASRWRRGWRPASPAGRRAVRDRLSGSHGA